MKCFAEARALRAIALIGALTLGCDPHKHELDKLQRDLDTQLVARQTAAQQLNEIRRWTNLQEQKPRMTDLAPGTRKPLDPSILTPFVPPPLPPESVFDTARSKRVRERIVVTERRIAELDKVLGEIRMLLTPPNAVGGQIADVRDAGQ